jgi:hypothetical protein
MFGLLRNPLHPEALFPIAGTPSTAIKAGFDAIISPVRSVSRRQSRASYRISNSDLLADCQALTRQRLCYTRGVTKDQLGCAAMRRGLHGHR